ncbi:MAG: hypothetical protein ACFB51_02455 [Anaerolineae bacterium]
MQPKLWIMAALRRAFRPEFINRVDATIVFRALSKDEITQIVDILLERVQERLEEHGLRIELTEAAKVYLAEEGYDPEFGARPLRRVLQNKVEDALSDRILSGDLDGVNTILVDYVDDELTFTAQEEMELPEPTA